MLTTDGCLSVSVWLHFGGGKYGVYRILSNNTEGVAGNHRQYIRDWKHVHNFIGLLLKECVLSM